MSDVGRGGGFLGALGAIGAAIANAIGHWTAITAARILEFLSYLKDLVLDLARQLVLAAFRLGRTLAAVIRTLVVGLLHSLRDFARWAYNRMLALSAWLRRVFAPIVRFLEAVRRHINDIYRRFVRPVLDVIDFIRQMNRVLELFHVHVLNDLDALLARIEAKINAPFIWVNEHITAIENWIGTLVDEFGLLRRATLIASMARHAPPWIAGFWNSQVNPDDIHLDPYDVGRPMPIDAPWAPGKELAQFYRGEDSRITEAVGELVPIWRQAAGVDPPGPDESGGFNVAA